MLFADEEAGGVYGGRYLLRHRPELFEGCSEVLGLEVGGFSFTLPADGAATGQRVYLVETAERGTGWGDFTTVGTQGHGSQINNDNPLVKLVIALHRLTAGDTELPAPLTETMRQALRRLADALGMEFDESDPMAVIQRLGPIAKWLRNSVRSGFNVTQIHGGEKDNMVPGRAVGTLDVRTLPGQEAEFEALLEDRLGSEVTKSWKFFEGGWENPLSVDAERAMTEAIREQDPDALVVGWVMPAGTDAKAFKMAFPEIPTYGFCPLRLPATLDFAGLFHAPDERVPVRTLHWGVRAFATYVGHCRVTESVVPRVVRDSFGGWVFAHVTD